MDRELFTAHGLEVAPQLLGARLSVQSPEGSVTLRITETEAYHGWAPRRPMIPARIPRTARPNATPPCSALPATPTCT
nr:DNA-3-methyladenine glycosylase [Arthrobacter sp. JCM 19049]